MTKYVNYQNNIIFSICYKTDKKDSLSYSNKNGIALLDYFLNGKVYNIRYFINKMYHNEYGPAIIINYEFIKSKQVKYYWYKNKMIQVSNNKEFKRYIKLQNIL